jgi:Protein of unknown function (DUF664)
VFDGPEDADIMVEGIPLDRLLAEYERECAASNEIIAAHSLETARHAGHMEAIRELLDGQKGYY